MKRPCHASSAGVAAHQIVDALQQRIVTGKLVGEAGFCLPGDLGHGQRAVNSLQNEEVYITGGAAGRDMGEIGRGSQRAQLTIPRGLLREYGNATCPCRLVCDLPLPARRVKAGVDF